MITRAERRKRRFKKIKQREKILKQSGFQGGSLYEKHEKKIRNNGTGYMSKHGNLTHYARGTQWHRGTKTRNRNSWLGTNNWKYKDQIRMLDMSEQEKEYREGE